MILLILTTGLALICLLVFSPTNNKELIVENSFLLFTLLNGWVKAAVILCKHKDIKNLLHTLLEDQCQPQDKTEHVIQQKFDNEARKVNVIYSLMVATAVILMYTSIFTIKEREERAAALNTWRPYDFEDNYFQITWVHEFFAHLATATVHMAVDSLVPGFIIQLCCQLQIFEYSRDLQKTIFETNWFSLSNETKRSLIIMMIRSKKPIIISIGSILFVNLNSFASILKASYSAFNVLQHSV
ncbi:uncharacterized protein LOC122501180 [Leptopilina heterotoma]|uniref:uncharacterized protein LOC122501180 n=1 Tax=Leptopilina heterotoma TaxID=63436 RepID=UPI001CA7DDF7|nr:uncharacterized protein LOC122501180 [Leptopilina heterotoma]